METLQDGFWVILLHLHHSLKTSLLFDIKRCSRLILYFSFSGLGISCPPRSPGFVVIVVFRNQDLDIKCAHCNWGVFASRPFIVQIFHIYTIFYILIPEPTCQCRRCRFDPWIGKMPWKKKWQPTPVLLPGKFHGERNLVGYSPWGYKESDMTEHSTGKSDWTRKY